MNMRQLLKSLYQVFFSSKRSYSQTGEDLVVDFYTRDIKQGVYVDIGANHPTYLSNTYLFYRRGWNGLCIEPSVTGSNLFKLLRSRDTLLALGIGEKPEQRDFYKFNPDTLSTFSSIEAKRYQSLGHTLLGTTLVRMEPLASVMTQYYSNQQVHILSVDTEGYDLVVLQSNDWVHFRPWFVIVETVEYERQYGRKGGAEIETFMLTTGYVVLAHTFINTIFIDSKIASSRGIIF